MSSTTDLFKDTFAYLEQNIDQHFYCEDFKKSHSKDLYDYLLKKHSKKDIKEHRSEIRRAFKSYFQLLNQKVSLFFQGFHTIIVKDLKKQIYGEYSKQFHAMSQKLESLNNQFENFKTSNGVYIIDKESLNALGCNFENIEDRALKKELYKQALKDVLDLDSRDLVFCMNDKLTVKKFMVIDPTNLQANIERRAGGLPPQELEKIKNIVFEKNIYEEIEKAMLGLMEVKLNFTVIDNSYFHKNAIPMVQDELYKVVSIYMDEDSDAELKKAFANYIFREHFNNIHLIFARHILDLHSKRDKNVEIFLKYYDGNIELLKDKQIQKPEIIDANDQRWNAVSMLPIIIQKQKNDREIEIIEENIEKAKNKIYTIKHKIEKVEDEIGLLGQKKEATNEQIRLIISESKELQDENTIMKQKRKKISKEVMDDLQERINRTAVEMKKLSREEDRLRISIRDIGNSIDVDKTKILNLGVDISIQEKLIDDNITKKENLLRLHQPVQEKYILIVDAVSKTLMEKMN